MRRILLLRERDDAFNFVARLIFQVGRDRGSIRRRWFPASVIFVKWTKKKRATVSRSLKSTSTPTRHSYSDEYSSFSLLSLPLLYAIHCSKTIDEFNRWLFGSRCMRSLQKCPECGTQSDVGNSTCSPSRHHVHLIHSRRYLRDYGNSENASDQSLILRLVSSEENSSVMAVDGSVVSDYKRAKIPRSLARCERITKAQSITRVWADFAPTTWGLIVKIVPQLNAWKLSARWNIDLAVGGEDRRKKKRARGLALRVSSGTTHLSYAISFAWGNLTLSVSVGTTNVGTTFFLFFC